MLPSPLAIQLRRGLEDFLRFSFASSTPGMEHVIDDFLAQEGAVLKGPWVSLKLPFAQGTQPHPFPRVPLPYPAHAHQERAWERLGGRRKRSTLIATGTGSGKTESFLLPILDHCLQETAHRGVKAILLYPMNALATDQALRIARTIHRNDALRGRVRAGLYIGNDAGKRQRGHSTMGEDHILTDRDAMQQDPPDILLTNYRMLDYLLLRPDDQRLWRHNTRGILRFLVVDELHTFDGAQGTDLACLIRRLKRRLDSDRGDLCCIGTSATLGGDDDNDTLPNYARAIFGEIFDDDAVITERRQDIRTFLQPPGAHSPDPDDLFDHLPSASDLPHLDPTRSADPEAWLHRQIPLWFGTTDLPGLHPGDPPPTPGTDAWRTALGFHLRRHTTFRALLNALAERPRALPDLVQLLGRARSAWREDPTLGPLALTSLLALTAHARDPAAETPAQREQRLAEGGAAPLTRLVDLRVQLWQRELARMVATVDARPTLRHSDDLPSDEKRRHLPLVHCRECGAMGWVTRTDPDNPRKLRTDAQAIYRDFFAGRDAVQFLFPAAARPAHDPAWRHHPPQTLDTATLQLLGEGDRPRGEPLQVVSGPSHRSTPRGRELSRDCPFCSSADSLTLVGFRAATLTSVHIDQLFASPFNTDRKLLTFSDSVQDAAHRAGFFGARTWRTGLRIALRQTLADRPGIDLGSLAGAVGPHWRQRMDMRTWVSTFIAPNMEWLRDWSALQERGELPRGSDLPALIERRIRYEVLTEFGLNAPIGRSLVRTQAAAVGMDIQRLQQATAAALEAVRNEVPGLRDLEQATLQRFLLGWLTRLRLRGGILDAALPTDYVHSGGEDVYSFSRDKALPAFGRSSRLPVLLMDRPGKGRFEPLLGRGSGWIARWTERALGEDAALSADSASLLPVLVPFLVRHGLLREQTGHKGLRIWGLDPAALVVDIEGQVMACPGDGAPLFLPSAEASLWEGMPALHGGAGHYTRSPVAEHESRWFQQLYASGRVHRIFAAEHTGLLGRAERERVEREFKAPERPEGLLEAATTPTDAQTQARTSESLPSRAPAPAGDAADATAADDASADGAPEGAAAWREPWYPNLLSCTPTLEMGIDIGDLGTTALCAIPPTQASYMQRVGRAGRRDGNAFLLAVANARPHDLYFYARPEEMLDGEVTPPGVFLDAAAVLERQLTAFCLDRWVAELEGSVALPRTLREVFPRLLDEDDARFPGALLRFIERHEDPLLREFGEMFDGMLSPTTRDHLDRFLRGGPDGAGSLRWKLLDAFQTERQHLRRMKSERARLTRDLQTHERNEARAEDHDEVADALQEEIDRLGALMRDLQDTHTLAFLTDHGLLPNYAFPESPVQLRSVIYRKLEKPARDGRRYRHWTFRYARSPASALSDLAPQADFYAGGRRVRIDRVDVEASPLETWRFCAACNHAQRDTVGEPVQDCPACGDTSWRDAQQQVRMLQLRQVHARAPDRTSRITDEHEDRRPRFFQRQMLVDLREEDRVGAWALADPTVPFAFEYLRRATFREVNFGERESDGLRSRVAGQEAVRPGFRICIRCGQVQDPRKEEPEHALSCPSRKAGAAQEIERCLYLYREFDSEAVRLLLPALESASHQELHSFVAALQMGLQTRFGGSVDHLRTTVYSDPLPGTALRKQYLVLFDTIPGGTGYLKQLVTRADDNAPLPLMEVLQLALERIEGCACWNTDEDGCYRCLYAFRNARDMDDTSARIAAGLLRRILDKAGALAPVERIGDVQVSGLLDSLLEARFVEALRQARHGGRTAQLEHIVRGNRRMLLWTLGDIAWRIQPQVDLGAADGVEEAVSIDFVLEPVPDTTRTHGNADTNKAGALPRPIAVFMDGWTFHKDRIGKDLQQRQLLQASGRYDVWSFTWDDMDAVLVPNGRRPSGEDPLRPDDTHLRRAFSRMPQWIPRLTAPLFELFVEHLVKGSHNTMPWPHIGQGLLLAHILHQHTGIHTGEAQAAWNAMLREHAPAGLRAPLQRWPVAAVRDGRGEEPLLHWMAVRDAHNRPACVVVLDDTPDRREDTALREAWQHMLRFMVLVRETPGAVVLSRSALEDGLAFGGVADRIARALDGVRSGDGEPESGASASERWEHWNDLLAAARPLAEALLHAGVPAPKIGHMVPSTGVGDHDEAEMIWDHAQVAIMRRALHETARQPPAPGWRILCLEDLGNDPAPVLAALEIQE